MICRDDGGQPRYDRLPPFVSALVARHEMTITVEKSHLESSHFNHDNVALATSAARSLQEHQVTANLDLAEVSVSGRTDRERGRLPGIPSRLFIPVLSDNRKKRSPDCY